MLINAVQNYVFSCSKYYVEKKFSSHSNAWSLIYFYIYNKDAFGRASEADSLLNLAGALPNSFLERSDSLLIL
jgi:hypothetical protein